jgi:hypothetical protein
MDPLPSLPFVGCWVSGLTQVAETHWHCRCSSENFIDDRYDKGSLLITSQVPVGRWHEVIGDMTVLAGT